MVDVTALDPTDPNAAELLRGFWDVEQRAHRADRTHPILRTEQAFMATMTKPSPYGIRRLFIAQEAGRIVGVAEASGSTTDNLHAADVEISVDPGFRRRGIGRRLSAAIDEWCGADGRTTQMSEINAVGEQSAAYCFATALGFETALVEDHLVLELPATPKSPGASAGYEILTWRGRCPEEYVDGYCQMRTQMNNDVPTGELDFEPVVFDVERLRVSEERLAKAYDTIVAAARRPSDGAFAGYSLVFVPIGEVDAIQDDTLVMPQHRGHRLGTQLKLATLAVIELEHPEVTAIHTWTAQDNHAMQRTNHNFGYRQVERLYEMQRRA